MGEAGQLLTIMLTNAELTEILKPTLDEVNKKCENWGCNDIQLNFSCNREGVYALKISTWAKGDRITVASLETAGETVAKFSPEEEQKKRKLAEIERLKSELAALET